MTQNLGIARYITVAYCRTGKLISHRVLASNGSEHRQLASSKGYACALMLQWFSARGSHGADSGTHGLVWSVVAFFPGFAALRLPRLATKG